MAYLRGRSAACRYKETTLFCQAVRTGIPQGSAESPLLVNYFVATYPENVQLHTGYVEDVHAVDSSVDPQTADAALTAHVEAVGQ